MRTSWQKFATLIPKNTRTCLAKQNQAGSYMWVTVKLITITINLYFARLKKTIRLLLACVYLNTVK